MRITDSTVPGWLELSFDRREKWRPNSSKAAPIGQCEPKKQILGDRPNVVDIDCDSRKVAFPVHFNLTLRF
jgi:hypothetical protein